ncbi:HIT domain-containing protein [Dyella monticola]|uniref:HIT domain-containing protein n=1 Tax=Dyella monticola TaxID=1927958 RepID=A0A370WSY1_9GAMM|nr:HIT domain-containing protein [Dyella monticola]
MPEDIGVIPCLVSMMWTSSAQGARRQRERHMDQACVFCRIVSGHKPASRVCEDEFALAYIDLRQFHPGHTLVVPKKHLNDVRELTPDMGLALIMMISRVT